MSIMDGDGRSTRWPRLAASLGWLDPTKAETEMKLRRSIEMKMRSGARGRILSAIACAALLGFVTGAMAQETLLVLRPVPPKIKKGQKTSEIVTKPLEQKDVGEIKIGGKVATITGWSPVLQANDYKGPPTLQLVVLIDSMEQIGINEQFSDMKKLFNGLPPSVEIAVGYLLQGKAKITQPFTTDRKLVGDALHVPTEVTLPKNDNGGQFQCLKDLAAHWPDPDPKKLRAVLMFNDGVDRYNNFQGGDQENPNVESAGQSLLRAGIMPFPFYYQDPNVYQGRSMGGQLEGQSNFDQLAKGRQGQALYQGQYSPSTFEPLLNRFYSILKSMAVATVTVPKTGFQTVDVKPAGDDVGVQAPEGVMIGNAVPKK